MPEWISVDEQLPEIGEEVLTVREDGCYQLEHTIIAAVDPDDSLDCVIAWFFDGIVCNGDVTHWMPLPEPPEEVKKDV